MKCSILISSVGGQDINPYLAFFSNIAKAMGEHIFIDYQKGFSQERCSESHSVRIGGGYGEILEGGADVVIATEQLEGVKSRFYPTSEGGLIVSTKRIVPSSVISGQGEYPKDCMQKCINDCFKVFEYNDNEYLTACVLALRLLEVDKKTALEQLSKVYPDIGEVIESAYSQKFVKA